MRLALLEKVIRSNNMISNRAFSLVLVTSIVSIASVGCSKDDDPVKSSGTGGTHSSAGGSSSVGGASAHSNTATGAAGSSATGSGGTSGGTGGAASTGAGGTATTSASATSGSTSLGGAGGTTNTTSSGTTAGSTSLGGAGGKSTTGSGGVGTGGASASSAGGTTASTTSTGTGGVGTGGSGTGSNAGGATSVGGSSGATYPTTVVDRGAYLVRSVALCGGCHTSATGSELAGNAAFKGGKLPAPNLTPSADGIGSWTDDQVKNAIRNGLDDQGRQLDSAMPYWFFHNMTDADVSAIVAFLRSLPPIAGAVGETNLAATAVAPISVASFPDSTLTSASADFAAATQGRYLLSSAARCVSCHSPSAGGLPSPSYFSGVAPAAGTPTPLFAPNITPDATGLAGWLPDDIAAALKTGVLKGGRSVCPKSAMPSAAKGYGGLTDADAHAIGVYLTTIPGVSNAAASPSLAPNTCP